MAIVTMKRLTLLAMDTDKETIFDALVRCGSVQLKRTAAIENCIVDDETAAREKTAERQRRVEEAIRFVTETVENVNASAKRGSKVEVPKGSFARPRPEVVFDYFLSFGEHAGEVEAKLDEVAALHDKCDMLQAQAAQKRAEYAKLSVYEQLPHPAQWYHDTECAVVRLCQLPASNLANLSALANEFETAGVDVIDGSKSVALVAVYAHKSEAADLFTQAAQFGLVKCNVGCDVLPRVAMEQLSRQMQDAEAALAQTYSAIAGHAADISEWKIYADWLALCEKKLAADGDLQKTDRTFVLEAYYPAESEDVVRKAIESVTADAVTFFDEIGEDEFAPTLLRNNKLVSKFESVTNSYTPPQYHEVDPNPTMAVFYFVIFGLMMADIGYGLVLMLLGLFATFAIKQQTGLKNMLQMFGLCGISAVAVGALFGSFFSYQLYDGVIPSPADYPMVMMLFSLLIGVVHVAAGVGCNMAVKIKHKQKLSAWLVDFPWIIMLAAFVVAIFNPAIDMMAYEPYNALKLPDPVPTVGLYVCLAALAVAVIFAGLGRKGIVGKLTGSFGQVYGLINYFSDIMSYIRIFGLLLSSALIGSVVNQLGAMVSGGGGFGYVAAAVLLIFAHVFNLAMGIMSIYIHNGRLQYVEFFGKFYTGDGQLFVPFGSDTKYTLVKR